MESKLELDTWLGSVLEKAVYKYTYNSDNLISIKWPKEKCMIYTKIDVNNSNVLNKLLREGFRLIDVNIQMKANIEKASIKSNSSIEIAQDCDELQIKEIAGKEFKYDRFHADPLIENAIAKKIKEKWVATYFKGKRGYKLYISRLENKAVGFVLIMRHKNSIVVDLLAVSNKYRGRGVGKNLLLKCLEEGAKLENDFIYVGSQLRNIPAINLYEKTGFRYAKSSFVLHKHNF